MSGVYCIRCTTTNELYVGGTTQTFDQRFVMHRRQLRSGCASIPKLQAAWDKYGEGAFEFIPLKEFPSEQVAVREDHAIEVLRPALNSMVGSEPRNRIRNRIAYRRSIGLIGDALTVPPHMNCKRYAVGKEMLTQSEIASRAGISVPAVINRLRRGIVGDALVALKQRAPRKPYVRK